MADKVTKGRQAEGVGVGVGKFSDTTIAEIRSSFAAGDMTRGALAKRFGVSYGWICKIIDGKTRRKITMAVKLLGPEKGKTLTFYLRQRSIDYVTRYANKRRLSRSDGLRMILAEHEELTKNGSKR